MAIQSGKGIIVVYKVEGTFNTVPPSAAGGRRLRFNGPSPGMNLSRADIQSGESRGDRLTPLGRKGEPSEFAGPAIFLASDASSFVSGVTLPVDGGYCIL